MAENLSGKGLSLGGAATPELGDEAIVVGEDVGVVDHQDAECGAQARGLAGVGHFAYLLNDVREVIRRSRGPFFPCHFAETQLSHALEVVDCVVVCDAVDVSVSDELCDELCRGHGMLRDSLIRIFLAGSILVIATWCSCTGAWRWSIVFIAARLGDTVRLGVQELQHAKDCVGVVHGVVDYARGFLLDILVAFSSNDGRFRADDGLVHLERSVAAFDGEV